MSDSNGRSSMMRWAANAISEAITERRIKKYNRQSRGLEEYDSITLDTLFPAEAVQDNIIVSGGDAAMRHSFSERIIESAANHGLPMIILHLGNDGLADAARRHGGLAVSRDARLFDPFTAFELPEICQVVFDTCKAKYGIMPAGRYLLQIVCELLKARKKRPYFAHFAAFEFHKIPDSINACLAAGQITSAQAADLNSLLMMGQAEIAKVDMFFYDMKTQLAHILASDPAKVKAQGILSAIKRGQLLCIDLNSSANAMLIELVVNSLAIAMNRGYEFSLFLGDVAIANNDALRNALCQKASHNNVIFSKDLYALLMGKDDIFAALCGEADKTVLLSHGSDISCRKWSQYIGEYEKIDVTRSYSIGESEGDQENYTSSRSQTMSDKREFKIMPEEINRLARDEVIIYDNQYGSLMRTRVEG